jgi:hypothetical protein
MRNCVLALNCKQAGVAAWLDVHAESSCSADSALEVRGHSTDCCCRGCFHSDHASLLHACLLCVYSNGSMAARLCVPVCAVLGAGLYRWGCFRWFSSQVVHALVRPVGASGTV